jgi:hypothetical protein
MDNKLPIVVFDALKRGNLGAWWPASGGDAGLRELRPKADSASFEPRAFRRLRAARRRRRAAPGPSMSDLPIVKDTATR